MKPVPTKFRYDGFDFEQVQRTGFIAIYRKRKSSWPEGTETFETVRIREMPAKTILDKPVEAHERYPVNEEWGTHGFSYPTLDKAQVRFARMLTENEPETGEV